jgi:hypothetical protein
VDIDCTAVVRAPKSWKSRAGRLCRSLRNSKACCSGLTSECHRECGFLRVAVECVSWNEARILAATAAGIVPGFDFAWNREVAF